ncbi:hypothetical protein [Alkalicoccus chagannorensis]|uniref:UPF0738 family protein n=1 Tax=Alkalicoccus chagannorensis TaxID=427072 RepID=UPI0004172372|nr:hypothetical protein [Alkalicoccus chagannorensis]
MITVKKMEVQEREVSVAADVTLPFQGLEPEDRMLVDSDGGAFVYLLAHQDEFIHLRFEENVWNVIRESRPDQPPVVLKTGLGSVELTSFWEELDFLLDNIAGNHNYGKDFVEKVERLFELEEER